MNRDLQFIAGKFFDIDLPNEKRYLLKYFTNDLQKHFVSYFLVFRDYDNFVDHTGYYCSNRWLEILKTKLETLERLKIEARQSIDLEKLALIESGNYKI